ncbi:DNA utilization protein GntX [Brenneria uluponensis]|uniref:DNA utilization protein GntX n=1 Tax=Brenneria uluponensis TaxID=3057057 RepID=UPI0028E507B0|nr:DNA utilization protein GntX [Brenneria ulupoensis]
MFTFMARCWLCQQPIYHSHHGICSHCLRHLPTPPTCCPRCGLPASSSSLACGRCLQKPPPWHALLFVSDYQPPVNTLLKQFKFQRRIELAPALARLILLQWQKRYRHDFLSMPDTFFRPDMLFTVPLHKQRHWWRGFNQTELLATTLAHWLGCDYAPHALTRTRKTRPQQELDATTRRRNLRNAFDCNVSLVGKRVVLLDDVVTTGSTVAEISRVLLAQGASCVQIWCLCRTL